VQVHLYLRVFGGYHRSIRDSNLDFDGSGDLTKPRREYVVAFAVTVPGWTRQFVASQ